MDEKARIRYERWKLKHGIVPREKWLESVRKPGFCSDCKQTKSLNEFAKNRARPNGISHICKRCQLARNQKWKAGLSKKRLKLYQQRNNNAAKKYRRNPETKIKVAAHQMVWGAMKLGLLIRKPCEQCGAEPTDAHHDDYLKPLEVRWLCRSCHKAHHAVNP